MTTAPRGSVRFVRGSRASRVSVGPTAPTGSMTSTVVTTGAATVVAAFITVVAGRALERHPPLGPARWARTNHAGNPVTLLEGPQVVLGTAVASVVAGAPVAALSALVAGGLGVLDDLTGDSSSKGLGGHLGALRRGRVTTGTIKVIGLAASGLVVGLFTPRRAVPGPEPMRHAGWDAWCGALQVLLDAGVVAGSANLVNLLDLRPGRAIKAVLLLGTPLAVSGSTAAAAAVGAAIAAFPRDLAGHAMLGDTGANALGAVLGAAAVARLPRPGRWAVLTGLITLTLASERVSFTAVIDRTPVLREIDGWGRRPAEPVPSSRPPR